MAKAWQRFRAAYLMELRLLCRHWSYLALHVIWGGVLWYGARNPSLDTARGVLEWDPGQMGIGVLSLAAMFVTGAAASRSHRVRFTGIDQTLPTGLEVSLGRWLAAVISLMGGLAEPLVLALVAGPASSWWPALPIYLAEAFITIAFTSVLAWFLMAWLGMRRWLYPVMGAWWLAFMIVPQVIRGSASGIPEADLFDFMRASLGLYRDLWGRLMEGTLPLWFDLFYLGLVVLALAGIAWRVRKQRLRRTPVAPALAAVVALAMVAAGAAGYVGQIRAWGRLADADTAQRQQVSLATAMRPPAPEVIDRYAVTADLTDPSAPRFVARMTLRNSGKAPLPSFTLTLHRSFTIIETSLPLDRAEDLLTVHLPQPLEPGGTAELTLRYSGSVFITERRYDQTPVPIFFTTDQGIRLSDGALWYPLAGEQMPLTNDFRIDVTPFAFDLQVNAPEGWGTISNLAPAGPGHFAGTGTTWAMLMASPNLAVTQVGQITLAAPRDQLARAADYMPDFQKVADYLRRFFPGVTPAGMTVILYDGESGMPDATHPDGSHGVIMTRSSFLPIARRYPSAYQYIGEPVLQDLWVMAGGQHPEDPFLTDVSYFLWNHYLAGGDAAMITAMAQPNNNSLVRSLAEVYAQDGDPGVIRVLTKLRKDPPKFDPFGAPDYLDAWVKEAARSDS